MDVPLIPQPRRIFPGGTCSDHNWLSATNHQEKVYKQKNTAVSSLGLWDAILSACSSQVAGDS